MVKLKYKEISNFAFAQAVQKISQANTHGATAALIHKVTRQLGFARKEIAKAYQSELVEKFGKRDEKGQLVRPDGEPDGFEPIEEKQEEFVKAQEDFGGREVTLDCYPFSMDILKNIQCSAADLEALKDMYVGNREDEKPALPGKASIAAVS